MSMSLDQLNHEIRTPVTGRPPEPGAGHVAVPGGERIKRVFDLAVAGALLILLLPAFALIAVAIVVESRGPVFYPCTRVGRFGREFSMLKFRKMHHDASGSPLTGARDERFTRIGRLLSAARLDELPQLINVMLGDMSLVGPRPEDPHFVALDPERFREVHRVRPGITGLSQLAFARESRILDQPDPMAYYIERLLPAKAQLDALYARTRTIGTDVLVMFWTAAALLARKEVAVWRDTGRMGVRRRRVAPRAAIPQAQPAARAVVFAGGVGTQLAPEASVPSRSLAPIGGRSTPEIVIEQIQGHGIADITVYVGDLEHPIEAVLANHRRRDSGVRLVREEEPRCTSALVRLVEGIEEPFLVVNGDAVSSIDYTAFVDHHRRSDNLVTIAGHLRRTRVDFEVLRCDPNSSENLLQEYDREADVMVNAGIYVVEPAALEHIPGGEGFDFSDLIRSLVADGQPVGVYPYAGFWLDVSRPEDYQKAVKAFAAPQVARVADAEPVG